MHSIYIDSTSGLDIGLLDPKFNWVELHTYDEKKPSEVIHSEIFKLVQKHGLDLKSMRLFVTAGPGSYTGMRLSEGLAQIFEMSGLQVFSFYHFEVPRLVGIKNGFWVTNAFKGQIFIFTWDGEKNEKSLVNKSDFKVSNAEQGFALDQSDVTFSDLSTTKELIHNESRRLFSKVLELQLRVSPYYFRTLEEEFR